jgi:hypothetical protein
MDVLRLFVARVDERVTLEDARGWEAGRTEALVGMNDMATDGLRVWRWIF